MATGYRPTRQEFDSYYASKGYTTDEIEQWWDANYKFDSWDAFKTGLNHGYQGLKYSAGSLGNAALGGEFGQQTMAEAQQAIADDELPPELQGRIWDKTGLLADPRTWAYGLGSVGPSVGLTVSTGGLGYLATGSRWAAALASGATGGALEAGPTYAEAIEMGQSQDEARMSGLAMGLATTGLNALPAARLFGPVGKLGRLGKAAQVGMAEAVTEVAEGPAEAVILGKDVYEALKDEVNVAPGAFLSGMILGPFGNRVSVPDAYEAGMALGGDPEMIIPSEKEMMGQMGPSREDMIRLQEDMTHRQREEENMWMQWDQQERTLQQQENQMWLEQEHEKEQGIQVSAEKETLYRKAEQARALDEAIKLEQEEEAFNILEPALELPKEIETELIASKVANVYAGKELNQMQLAFSKALNQLPDGVQEGFNRAMPQESEQQQRDDPERLLPPIAETVSDNPAVAHNRAVELEQFASHGTSPLQEVTPVEEQAMERVMQNLAEPPELRSYPPGVGITPTPQGFQVMSGGQPVATFPKLRQAEIYAQLSAPEAVVMDEPMVPVVDAMEPTVDRDTRVQRSYAKVILDTPATSSRLQVGPKTIPLLNSKLVEKSEGVAVGTYGTFKQANYAQSVMFDRAIDNLIAWGMPTQSFAGLDGMMVHEKDGIAPMGAYVTYKNGKRLLSMDADLMDLGFTRNESELVTQSFAHELGHHVGNEYALQSELFTPGGDIVDELAYVYRGRDPRRVWAELQYPMIHMEDIADNPSLIPMIAKESFAQIHGIYYTYGSTAEGRAYLKDLMPRSIQLMDEVKNAINSATAQQRATALQKAFRIRDSNASHSPVVAGTLVADFDGGLGGRQASGRVQGTENAGSFRRDSFDRYITVKGQTKTKAFKEWFGDSKVVDEDGEPLVVYHGTNRDISEFDPVIGKEYGVYTTPREKYASLYGDVKELFLKIEKPKIIEWKGDISPSDLTLEDVKNLQSQGYDGIVVVNKGSVLSKASEIIAFKPNQVKSATGNKGTFDPENPRIDYYNEGVIRGEENILDDEYDKGLLEGFNDGELLVHARVKDGTDFTYGIDPSAGEFLRSTESYQTAEEFHGEGPELTFFSDNSQPADAWAGYFAKQNPDKDIELVFVLADGENLQKSLGNGQVELPNGETVSYEMSPIADYENPNYASEPGGVEKGDWYTNESQDVIGTIDYYNEPVIFNDGLRYTDFESYRKPNGKVYAEVAKQGFESPASVRKGIDAGLKKLGNAEPAAFTFYEDLGKYLDTVSNGDRAELDRMARTIALLSTDNSTATDFNWWLKATNAIQTAERDGAPMAEIADTFSQYPEQMRTYLEAATKARTFTQEIPGVGPKVQGFYRSLMDAATGENQFPNAAVADSDSFRAMGGTGKAKIDPRVNRLGNEMIRQITDEYNQTTGSNWLPRNIQSALTTQGAGNAAKYAAGLEDRAGTVTVTTEPSSAMGEWVTGLSTLQRQQFDTGAKKLITGKNGEDLLAKVLGIPGFNGFLPDNQLQGAAALRTSQKFNRNQVRAYTQSLQYIYQQEAVPWARPDPNGNNVGVVLQTKGALSDLELEDLHGKVENSIQKAAFTRIGQESILLVNHANDPAFAQKVDTILANQSKIKSADLVGVEAEYGADHNWTDDPRGKGLLESIINATNTTPGNSGRDPSVLREWLLDRHAAYARYVTEQREALSADSKNPIASVDLMQEPEHEPRFEPPRPDTEYAGSVNRKHWTPTDLENEADVWDTTKGLSEEFETEFTKHRRGQRSWGTTERAAAALGMSETQLIKSKLGTTGNAEQLERARFMAMRAAQDLTAANAAYQETHSDQAAMELHKTRARAALIIRSYQGLATEAGRALNILRKDTAVIKNVGRALEDLGGKEQLDQFSKMLEHMQTTGKINKFADDSLKATTSDVLLELWINALLSGPQTHAVNVFSNGLVSMFSDLETFVAAGIGKLHGGNKISFREAASYTTGTLEGALKGLKLAGTAFKTEIPSGVGKIEARRYQAISAENLGIKGEKIGKTVDKIGRIVRIPGRGLLAGDELFKSVARTKKLHQIAMRNALHDAKNSAQVRTLYKQNREAPTEEMLDEAQDWADYQTFTKELGSFGKHIQQLANKHPLMRVLIPFIRTPTNIVKFAIERSPGAVIFKEVRDDLMGKNGNVKRDEAASRILIGSSIGALVGYLTAQGLITGGGPEDGRERNAMRSRGWQPYSFMVGDEYIAFNRLEPLGMLFGISADMVEVSDVLEKDDQANIASLITISIAKNLTSKTWLRGISEAVNALTDPERYGPYYIRNLLGTLVPTGIAQIARVDDPLLRDAQNIVDKWKSRIPGMTSQVPMKYDIFGNEIRLEGGIGPDIISPIYTSRIKSDPVFNAMKEIGYYPGKPTRKILGIKLKPDQYAEYSRLSGKGAYRMLHDLVRLRGYRMLPSHEKERILKKAYRESRKMARLLLIKRFPDLALQLRAVEARRQAERQRSPMGQQIYQAVGAQ